MTQIRLSKNHLALRKAGIQGLAEPANLTEAVMLIKSWLGKRKASFYGLRLILDKPNALETDIAYHISDAIRSVTGDEQIALWNSCNRELKSQILIPNDTLDTELFRMLGLPCSEIVRSYLNKFAFPAPIDSPYSTHYTDYDYDSGERLVEILKGLSTMEALELVNTTDLRIFYLVAVEEIQYFVETDPEEGRPLFCAFDYGDQVPMRTPFLFWMQSTCPMRFWELVDELKNRNWDELRSMFYEVFYRTNRPVTGRQNEIIDNPSEQYLDDLLRDKDNDY